jgi:acetyl esterase/lipase
VEPEDKEGLTFSLQLQIIGDRFSFLPYWLLNACAARKWIFVTPNYRLIPESTAHDAVADALDAFLWVKTSLSRTLGVTVGPVISAGSSAGAYLAMISASVSSVKPDALVLLYGMLDPSSERYTTPGTNIFGMPPIDGQPILDQFETLKQQGRANPLAGYPVPSDLASDFRMGLIAAAHCMGVLPDLMTSIPGLSRDIARHSTVAIPTEAKHLFPIGCSGDVVLPRTAILHGKNDNVVPFAASQVAADTLRKMGTEVYTEFLDDACHSFDTMVGNINIEKSNAPEARTPAFDGLRRIIKFLDEIARP